MLYHYTGCGLDYVYLQGGVTFHETDYGDGVSIQNIPSLYKALLKMICEKRAYLEGQDIRFIRKEFGMDERQFAKMLEVESHHFLAWENDLSDMPFNIQSKLKMICWDYLLKKNI